MDIINSIDFAILDALQKIHFALLNYIMAFFTYIGEGGAVWIAAALILMFIRSKRPAGFAAALSLIFELIFNENILKHIFHRTRPFLINTSIDTIVHRPSSYSFPSGHTCSAFAAATAIFCFDKRLGTIAYIVAALIGFSRNYFYIHYPTDVLCGALFGVLLGLAAAALIKAFIRRRQTSSSTDRDQ